MQENPMDPRSISWTTHAAEIISAGHATIGIELGSTRIKACLTLPDGTPAATGSHEWQNSLVEGHWSYALADVWIGLQDCLKDLIANIHTKFGVRPRSFKSMGISAMMHGYLAFDDSDTQLVPFRTWRDTYTGEASEILTENFGVNIPLRWSVAHYFQALLDKEEHVGEVAFLTTLAGYVHWKLTGEKVLGVGDAAGVFPIDSTIADYDQTMLDTFDELAQSRAKVPTAGKPLKSLLPQVRNAGDTAGKLTVEGARLLDPTGALKPGIPLCPPEGDAGTGMVATNSIRPRTGNVSVGTSIFAMIVLEDTVPNHTEVDPVTTPDGRPVAMVHCNNGAQELSTWIELFSEVALAFGKFKITSMDEVYAAILTEALHGEADGGGLLTYNFVSGEPIAGLADGRPLLARTPEANLTLANFMRAQLYSAFATLAMGMQILEDDGVEVDELYAHGGLFRTAGVAQRMLAAALNTPIGLAESASEGGAWGIALLALYMDACEENKEETLDHFLTESIFAGTTVEPKQPEPRDVAGFATYLESFKRGLVLEHSAVGALPVAKH
ncbi:xylulokinase [uncultured Corynebacterium sp.]|uniref:xylulokinase n=1 Tax=uncultured Corynebacterium sp. TaxID=159447 RepID=UPI0025F87EFA|nr:FGGY-family carbohydrate kinase [uncultured Corynebacterium sp.]